MPFVDQKVLDNMTQKSQNKEFLEYITTELSEEKVGIETKVLLESDSSYENDICDLKQFISNNFITQFITINTGTILGWLMDLLRLSFYILSIA